MYVYIYILYNISVEIHVVHPSMSASTLAALLTLLLYLSVHDYSYDASYLHFLDRVETGVVITHRMDHSKKGMKRKEFLLRRVSIF